MKQASILMAFILLLGLSATAQTSQGATSPAPAAVQAEKKTQRITIVTKKVDESGQTVTETYIAEGDKPEELIKEMMINPEGIQQVDIQGDTDTEKEERLFLFRSAGDGKVVEGTLNEDVKLYAGDKTIMVTRSVDENGEINTTKTVTVVVPGHDYKVHGWSGRGEQKANCAALGVFIANGLDDTWGARINSIIESGGAEKAGLQSGDIIKNIDEFDVSDFSSLYFALSNFMPGDKVDVRFERDGKTQHAEVVLTGWDNIPGFEYKARGDCKQEALPTDDPLVIDDPDGLSFVPEIQALELEDASIFPNPTDGRFKLSFKGNPGPLSVSIVDANGRTVYNEDLKQFSGSYSNEISIRDYPQGNYIINIKQNDKVFSRLISKQ